MEIAVIGWGGDAIPSGLKHCRYSWQYTRILRSGLRQAASLKIAEGLLLPLAWRFTSWSREAQSAPAPAHS